MVRSCTGYRLLAPVRSRRLSRTIFAGLERCISQIRMCRARSSRITDSYSERGVALCRAGRGELVPPLRLSAVVATAVRASRNPDGARYAQIGTEGGRNRTHLDSRTLWRRWMGQSGRFARTYRGREICFLDLAINSIQGQTSHQGPRAHFRSSIRSSRSCRTQFCGSWLVRRSAMVIGPAAGCRNRPLPPRRP